MRTPRPRARAVLRRRSVARRAARVRHRARRALIGASGGNAFGRWRGKGETGGMSSPAAEAAADALQTDIRRRAVSRGLHGVRRAPQGPGTPRRPRRARRAALRARARRHHRPRRERGRHPARHLRRLRPARRRRRDAVAARPHRRGPAVGAARAAPFAPVPRAAPHVERDGRAPRRRVQQGARARASCAASSPRRGSRCTRSCAATSGTCCRPRSAGACSPSTAASGAAFQGVIANTVASFALGDYEWLLPLEADELTDLVDLMRDLRATDARRHVREEVPFYTGRRVSTAELVEVLQ